MHSSPPAMGDRCHYLAVLWALLLEEMLDSDTQRRRGSSDLVTPSSCLMTKPLYRPRGDTEIKAMHQTGWVD